MIRKMENPDSIQRLVERLRDGARQFHALKADLEAAVRDAEAGAFTEFDPGAYEPDAFPRQRGVMTIRMSRLAQRDLDDIRRYTTETWGHGTP